MEDFGKLLIEEDDKSISVETHNHHYWKLYVCFDSKAANVNVCSKTGCMRRRMSVKSWL